MNQSNHPLSRRDFLRVLGLGGAALLGGGILNACTPKGAAPATAPTGVLPPTGTRGNTPQPTAAPPGTFDVEIALRAAPAEVQILEGAPTRVWQYQAELLNGPDDALIPLPDTYLGSIINLHNGQRVRVHFTNGLPEESIVHWHGLHVPVEADGHPRFAIKPGETYVYDFTVDDRAGTYWYHPHPHGRTGPQAYYGLAGLLLIHDEEEQALGLPSGEYDVPLVLQDRTFDGDNQLVYGGNGMMDQMMGFLGNRMLVNGQTDFTLPVATRPYRLRLHNGSNSRIYKLAWEDGTPLTVIATTGGLLEKPVRREYVTLAPAQRVELWVDFSGRTAGEELRLVSLPSAAPGGSAFPVLNVKVARQESSTETLPERLSTITWHNEAEAVNRSTPRTFTLAMSMGRGWSLNGRTFQMTEVAQDEIVKLGDLEVWEFVNRGSGGMGQGMGMGMALPHPMHVHGLQFQVIGRKIDPAGKAAWETVKDGYVDEGWLDTVLVMPGERVKILLQFKDFTGLYLYHCHNLEHEDMGMMRNYRVDA